MNKLLLILVVFLAGCSLLKPEQEYVYVNQQLICDELPQIKTGIIYPVVFVNARTLDGKEVLGLDGENYSNLALNTRAGIEYIKSQKAYINYLTNCIKRHNEKGEQ